MGKVCAFFGHRDIWCDLSEPLEQAARKAIAEFGVTDFWVGGYGDFDSCAAGCIRRLKKEFPKIRLHLILAYLPTKNDPLLDAYDSTIYPDGLELAVKRFALSKRNRWIVKHCDMVIGYVNHSYGGAYAAYTLAKKAGRIVLNLSCLESEIKE